MTDWWRDAVIYQIYIRSFADADGDGLGDIAGIRSRLRYLADLGVDAVWVNPWYPSPMADAGYDVADYRAVEPRFGTLADAEAMVREAHDVGLRVLLDIVPNHSSDRHAWFTEALEAGPGSPARERYLFRPGRGADGAEPPNAWQSVFGGPAWERVTEPDGSPGEWYLHLFAPEQPDLNWEHPDVRADFEKTLRFWFDRGVDGFRIDVAHSLVKEEGLPDAPDLDWPRQPVEVDGELRRAPGSRTRSGTATRCTTSTASGGWWPTPTTTRRCSWPRPGSTSPSGWPATCAATSSTPRSTSPTCRPPGTPATCGTSSPRRWRSSSAVGAPATWVLSNHDVVRHVSRYAREQTGPGSSLMQVLGRPADLELGRQRARAAVLLTLGLPGGAYVYQGEELGLEEVEDLPDEALEDPTWERSGHTDRGRDGCRVPVPWSGDAPPYGFSPAGATRAALAAAAGRLGPAQRRGADRRPRPRCWSSTARRCGCGARRPRSATGS